MLAVAFVLSIGTFVFAAGEARAQPQPDTTVTHTVVIDGEVAEQTAETPIVEKTYLAKTSSVETSPVESPPVVHTVLPASEPATPVSELLNEYDPKAPPVDPDPAPGEDPELEPVPAPEPGSAFLVEPVPPVDPAPVDQHDPGMEPAPELVFEPVALEENEPLPPPVEKTIPAPAVLDPGEEGLYPPPGSLETAVSSVVETFESAATDALGSLADGSLLSVLFSGEEADPPAPAGEDPGSSPFKLLLPVGSDFFSLLGSEIGSGGAPLLLLCVLASSLVLLRRERKLLWASRELPKPSSVPCPALERPG